MEFSSYQKAIFDFVKNQTGNAVVNAKAGASKTTTLTESLKYVKSGGKVCLLAFNKAIAEELKTRVPSNVHVQTFHALGWSVVNRNMRGAKLDNDKVVNHINVFFNKIDPRFKDFSEKIKCSNRIRKTIDFLRLSLISEPTDMDIIKIGIEQDMEYVVKGEIKWIKGVYGKVIKDSSCFDFTDMLFYPLYKNWKFPKFDFIAIDECQDLSTIQHKLFLACMNEGARFLAVGDEKQSIMAFAGANQESYNLFKKYENTREFPLSICYRCGENIIKHAQKLVPEIEWYYGCGQGSVIHDGSISNVKDGDVILCRTNSPLVVLACEFLKDGRKAKIKGADFGKNLAALIRESKAVNVADLLSILAKNLDKIRMRLMKENPLIDYEGDHEYQRSYDKTQSIKALCAGCVTLNDLSKKIDGIFSDSSGMDGIILSTIHKFKGLEADNVFIIEPQLIPFPYYLNSPSQKLVENNLDYVARTRAKKKLEYIRDWSSFKSIKRKEAEKSEDLPPQQNVKSDVAQVPNDKPVEKHNPWKVSKKRHKINNNTSWKKIKKGE